MLEVEDGDRTETNAGLLNQNSNKADEFTDRTQRCKFSRSAKLIYNETPWLHKDQSPEAIQKFEAQRKQRMVLVRNNYMKKVKENNLQTHRNRE